MTLTTMMLGSLLGMPNFDGWTQTTYSYVSSNVDHACGTSIATTSSPVGVTGTSGVDDSTTPHRYPQMRTGDDPTPGPTWASPFTPLVNTTWVNQTWVFPGQTIPAYTQAGAFTHWRHENGTQSFDDIVGGATTASARRDLDWWTPLGSEVIYSPNGGPPND